MRDKDQKDHLPPLEKYSLSADDLNSCKTRQDFIKAASSCVNGNYSTQICAHCGRIGFASTGRVEEAKIVKRCKGCFEPEEWEEPQKASK